MITLEDHNPKRKNLSIVSTIIILYIASGAQIDDSGSHSLPFLNINVEHPWVVHIFTVMMLAWCAIRYWQSQPPLVFYSPENTRAANDIMEEAWRFKTFEHLGKGLGSFVNRRDYNGPDKEGYLCPNFLPLKTLRPFELVKQIRSAKPILLDSNSSVTMDESKIAKAPPESVPARLAVAYTRPTLLKAFRAEWRLRRDLLLESGTYYDWLLPWALFSLSVLLMIAQMAFYIVEAVL